MRRRLSGFLLLILVLALPLPVVAQGACSHVVFDLGETTLAVDRAAVCRAAEPWRDEGFRAFVYLTDFSPPDEATWFAQLDEVETRAGLRQAGGGDNFDSDVLALEASTDLAADALTVTIGEGLFDTALDSNAGNSRVQNALRTGLAAGDATAAFTGALEAAYALNFGSGGGSESTGAGQPAAPPVASTGGFPWGVVLLGLVVIGGVAFTAVYLYPREIQPRLALAEQRRRLQAHLEQLQPRIANLLNAAYRLLDGQTPEEALLYRLFTAYGGEQAAPLGERVREWVRRSQAALNDAFDLHKKLQDPATMAGRDISLQVRDWELLYLTLVGSDPEIVNLSEEGLRDLLNPALIIEREPPEEAQLARQLDDIRREIEGLPLKSELRVVDPTTADRRGILGYIDETKQVIARLQAAQAAAPERLAAADDLREGAEEVLPDRPFGMTKTRLFAPVNEWLERGRRELDDGRFLFAIDAALAAEDGVETILYLNEALAAHAERAATIAAIRDQGYRPPDLPALEGEVAADETAAIIALRAGDYGAAANWIWELNEDSRRALDVAEAWPALQAQNEAALADVSRALAEAQALARGAAASAWADLQQYPPENWREVTAGPAGPEALLRRLDREALPQIRRQNDLERQAFPAAEAALAEAAATLGEATRALQAIVHRRDEIVAAAAQLPDGLAQAAEELAAAVAFRDAEDPKIGADVDDELATAAAALTYADSAAAERFYIAAAAALAEARSGVASAQAAADAQVARLNALLQRLDDVATRVEARATSVISAGSQLAAPVQTEASRSHLGRLAAARSAARQATAAAASLEDYAWAAALEGAIAAWEGAAAAASATATAVAEAEGSYRQQLEKTTGAIEKGQQAIIRATRYVQTSDALGSGAHALERARGLLPSLAATIGATREALVRMEQDALSALAAARDAEQSARSAIRRRRTRRRTGLPGGWGWGWDWGGSGAGFPRSRRRTRGGTGGWSGGRSRSGGRSSSRRRSSGGSSRRRSSFGGSRRSSGGRSRRR